MSEENGNEDPIEYVGMMPLDEEQVVTLEQLKELDVPQGIVDGCYQIIEDIGEENVTMALEEVEDDDPILRIYISDNTFIFPTTIS